MFEQQNLSRVNSNVLIKVLYESDIIRIVDAFEQSNWLKPISIFEKYLSDQRGGNRNVWVASIDNQVAGYVTLNWHSSYKPFAKRNIPEIMDLNTLPEHRAKGIGSALLDIAEKQAATRCDEVGLGVGLYYEPLGGGYGSAQKLYVKRGYIPNGLGITYNYKPLEYGQQVTLDDDLILWFTKRLR